MGLEYDMHEQNWRTLISSVSSINSTLSSHLVKTIQLWELLVYQLISASQTKKAFSSWTKAMHTHNIKEINLERICLPLCNNKFDDSFRKFTIERLVWSTHKPILGTLNEFSRENAQETAKQIMYNNRNRKIPTNSYSSSRNCSPEIIKAWIHIRSNCWSTSILKPCNSGLS